ncbi:phosphatidic acid phosphatase type 2/haloperoxidase [Zychaea mexicana]|uniref:phosphatidic acid phosphatase type 2/haloperoxidase n=1 Tax=Zychaea mexicana TaxID=64656 RepID=UPI0022FEAFD1|nr:phosphatidic acid phosphatase type 2/haloperoxidase [Zychaea mexicana]KAI9494470.1 phosphatidic acid phosphatase type 2/haloperoxidase [Zychaea mexicana]
MFGIKWKDRRTQRLFYSYGKDWLLVVIMTVVFFGIDLIPPFHREFSLRDESLMHSYTVHESVPAWTLALICLIGPIVFIGLVAFCLQGGIHDFHSGVLGLCLALSMTIMLTDIIKITSGRPRPDFISRCQPSSDAVDPPMGLSNYTVCTTPIDSYVMKDGYKSFPSGHSSFSFAGLGYLAFYIGGKMHMFDERGHTYKCFLFAFPGLGALLVAISRTRDYRHHWQDVFIGALLGASIAYFAYRQYYPSLIHVQCDTPFAMRSLGSVDSPEYQGASGSSPYDDERSIGSNNSWGVTTHEPYTDGYTQQQQQQLQQRSKPSSPQQNGGVHTVDRY